MSATNETSTIGLSQYISTDKPTYLVDYNGDMLKIDNAIAADRENIAGVSAVAVRADGKADTNRTSIDTINEQINGNPEATPPTTGIAGKVTTLENSVNTMSSLLGNGHPTTSDQTVIGAINNLEDTIAPSEDESALGVDYVTGAKFMRGGKLYEALTDLTSGTAFSALTLNTDYKVADKLVKQIADVVAGTATLAQEINTTFENKFVLDAVVTSVNVETLATDTLADLGTKFYVALNALKASLESDEIIELTNFSVAGFGTLRISNSSAGVITPTSALASGYHFNTMDSEASKFNIREISLGNSAGNASLTTIATGSPSGTINRVYYDGTHVFGGTDNYLNYRKYKKISAI